MPISQLTPIMPSDDHLGVLRDKAFALTKMSSSLATHAPLLETLSQLVRTMNCYYSNLIEGHSTLPHDVEEAMKNSLPENATTRDLVAEAVAHIEVQKLIDEGEAPSPPMSVEFLKWCHKNFYERLPESMLNIQHPDSDEIVKLIPGEFRTRGVKVGNHAAPDFRLIESMLGELFKRYDHCRGADALITIASANHRVAWVHPFIDGNGRTIRLMAHAALRDLELNVGLWSPSRGLARTSSDYKLLLAFADQPRQGASTDGRGSLTEKGLVKFCAYYLDTCIDQVTFMSDLFNLHKLQDRVEKYVHDEHRKSGLSLDSFVVLREVINRGEFDKAIVPSILSHKSPVTARRVVKGLLERKLLVFSNMDKKNEKIVRLGVPLNVLSEWFPDLYPEKVLSKG